MKVFYALNLSILFFIIGYGNAISQLRIKGVIYSESIAVATVSAQGITGRENVYMSPPKQKIKKSGLVYYESKYEVPWRIEKGTDHVIKFTDGLVEKMIYVSGVVPEEINPRQKFIIDVDLIENDDPDMTLIVFWSVESSSYKALPLAQLAQIREETTDEFFWNTSSAPDSDDIRRSSY